MILKRKKIWLLFFTMIILFDICMGHLLNRSITSSGDLKKAQEKEIMEELLYFPIPLSLDEKSLTWSFTDTWNQSRTYGGDRHHEGTDIITAVNEPGVYPVVSMSDGTIEKIGWLQLGGWRMGIRTDTGLYLYYAHLESYMPGLKEGAQIRAGECIGYVGDSGYGPEGTTGQFVTHLHVGIYLPDKEGEDQARNPYPFLEKLSKKQLRYHYGY